MTQNLEKSLQEVAAGLQQGRFPNEAAISQGIVLRILNDLGWPVFEQTVVAPEFSVEGRRVDFALCPRGKSPAVFIEVKQPHTSAGGDAQLFDYAFRMGVPLALLCNGQVWEFFLPTETGGMSDRQLYHLDILSRTSEDSAARLRKYLGYDGHLSGEAIDRARRDHRDRQRTREVQNALVPAWQALLKSEDDALMQAFAAAVERESGFEPPVELLSGFVQEQLKRLTGVPSQRPTPKQVSPPRSGPQPRPVQMGFTLNGEFHPHRSASDTLVGVLTLFIERDATFADRFAARPHGRSRRWIARDKRDLYPGRPDLQDLHSRQLPNGWWAGVNNSRQTSAQIIQEACKVADVRFGQDLVLQIGDV